LTELGVFIEELIFSTLDLLFTRQNGVTIPITHNWIDVELIAEKARRTGFARYAFTTVLKLTLLALGLRVKEKSSLAGASIVFLQVVLFEARCALISILATSFAVV
jgi:hypothetical protein